MTSGALRQGIEEKLLAGGSPRHRGGAGLRYSPILFALAACLNTVPLAAQTASDPLRDARGYEAAQKFDQAAGSYREYLSKHGEDDEVRTALARVLSWQGQYEEASRLYEEVLSRHPVDVDVRLALARVRSWQKQYGEAQAGYRAILRYESLHLITDAHPSQDGVLLTLIQTLHGHGYRQLRTQKSYRNGVYLGSQELWVEYPDPQ